MKKENEMKKFAEQMMAIAFDKPKYVLRAIESGAKPKPVLREIIYLQDKMRKLYFGKSEQGMKTALEYMIEIGKKAKQEIDSVDQKWQKRFDEHKIPSSLLDCPEYLNDLINGFVLVEFADEYKEDGKTIEFCKKFYEENKQK